MRNFLLVGIILFIAILAVGVVMAEAQDYTAFDDEGDMLILVYDDFYDQILELAQWKEQKGIKATVVKISETYGYQPGGILAPETRDQFSSLQALDVPAINGQCCYGSIYDPDCIYTTYETCDDLDGYDWDYEITETAACYILSTTCQPENNSLGMHNYIVDFYAENPNLQWILLVGDANKVSTKILTRWIGGNQVDYASDNYFGKINSFSSFPDFVVGRFCAYNSDQLATMIERTIIYERDLPLASQTDLDWYHKALLIARADYVDENGDPYGDMHIDLMQSVEYYLKLGVSPYTLIESIYERVEDEADWSPANVANKINNGLSLINYAGHASAGGWEGMAYGSISPVIGNLQNANRLPLVYSIGCETAPIHKYFDGTFGEKWIEETDSNGDPIGAIASYMNSVTINFTTQGMLESNRLLSSGINITIGAILYNGSMKLVDNSNQDFEFNSRILFGDPSIVMRTNTPAEIVAVSGDLLFGSPTYSVNVTETSTSNFIENAHCALYYVPVGETYENGILFGSGYTDVNGQVVLNLTGDLPINENVLLTVTGQNLKTSVQQIMVQYDLVTFTDPLPNTNITLSDYTVTCNVFSNSDLIEDSPILQYYTGTIWVDVPMSYNMVFEYYTADIPAQQPGTEIQYKIWTKNENLVEHTTETYSFEVYTYHASLSCLNPVQDMPDNVEIWYDIGLLNDGAYITTYMLSITDNEWPVTIYDETGILEWTFAVSIPKNQTYHFKLKVVVSSNEADAFDDFNLLVVPLSHPTKYATMALTAISNGPALTLPLYDEFTTTVLDVNNWQGKGNMMTIDAVGLNEPSEPYSMHFFRSSVVEPIPPGGPLLGDGFDWTTSNFINLKDDAEVYVEYDFQRTGGGESPEEGDDLMVEYFNNLGQWQLLYRHLGSQSDMTTFGHRQILLDQNDFADAYHERFQVRFRNIIASAEGGIEPNLDSWFIDNFRIGHHMQTPVLYSPFNGQRLTTASVTLAWNDLDGETMYEIEVDNNMDFSSVNRIGQVEETNWSISPGVINGTYYWRVRAFIDGEWSPWSTVWQFQRDYTSPPPVSCPVLYSFDGQDYIENNPLLTACELNGYSEDVYDYYMVEKPLQEVNGKVKFQLRELEEETTYLNSIELLTIDHEKTDKIGCSVDGQIFNYNSIIKPISAIDNKGVDWIEALLENDETFFNSDESGYLVVKFELSQAVDRNFGMNFSAGDKQICSFERFEVADAPSNPPLTIEFLNSNDEWEIVDNIPPRVNDKDEIVFPAMDNLVGLNELTMRLSWDDVYSTDFIQLVIPEKNTNEVVYHSVAADKLILSANSNVEEDNKPVTILNKGDVYEFVFDVPELKDGLARTYIIKAHGKYMPNNYSRGIPQTFALKNNYPNPFNPTTTISYEIPYATNVKIEIFNLLGQKVETIVDVHQEAGYYSFEWDASHLASGMYLYRLQTNNAMITKKMVMIK